MPGSFISKIVDSVIEKAPELEQKNDSIGNIFDSLTDLYNKIVQFDEQNKSGGESYSAPAAEYDHHEELNTPSIYDKIKSSILDNVDQEDLNTTEQEQDEQSELTPSVTREDAQKRLKDEITAEDYNWVDDRDIGWHGDREYFADPNSLYMNDLYWNQAPVFEAGHYEYDPSKAANSRHVRPFVNPSDEMNKTTNAKAEAVANASFGQGDYVYQDDPTYQMAMSSIQDMDPYEESKIPKTSYALNAVMPNITSTSPSSQAVNDVYQYVFNDHPEWAEKSSEGREVDVNGPKLNDWPIFFGLLEDQKPLYLNAKIRNIDDGRPENRTSPYMKGEQYIEYLNAGLGTRDPKTVDPDSIYSKYEEEQRYGFRPYLPTEEDWTMYDMAAKADIGNNLFADLSKNFKNNYTSRTYDFGDGRKYDANEFMDYSRPWIKRVSSQISEYDADGIFSDTPTDDMSVPMINKVQYTDPNTDEKELFTLDDWNNSEHYVNEDGTVDVVIGGKNLTFDNEDQANEAFVQTIDFARDEEPQFYMDLEPYEVAGDKIRADEAWDMIYAARDGDPSVKVDNGIFGKENPDTIITKDGELQFNPAGIVDFPSYFVDLVSQSAPLFNPVVAYSQAIPAALSGFTGMKPGHVNSRTGEYAQLSEDNTVEQAMFAGLGNAALPGTERILGNIGGNALGNVSRKFGGKIGKVLGAETDETVRPVLRWAAGTGGEAVEEVPGNIIEEFANGYGPSEFYATPTGETDMYGHEIRDTNTSIQDRWRNFWKDAPEALLGGATLGGGLGVGKMPRYGREYEKTKDGTLRPGYFDGKEIPYLNKEEIEYYDR